jgi:hypothetical protein
MTITAPAVAKKETLKEDAFKIHEVSTAETIGTSDSPASTKSSESLVLDDPTYVSPSLFDILVTDITAAYLQSDLSQRLGIGYLSTMTQEDALEQYMKSIIHGSIITNNKRFLVNLPCRRASPRNDPSSPKSPLPFVNVFFLVDTGSPWSFVCPQAMEALTVGGPRNPIPACLDVELLTGNPLELHLSPSASHFSGINLLGGSALSVANIVSNNRKNKFYLEFNEA